MTFTFLCVPQFGGVAWHVTWAPLASATPLYASARLVIARCRCMRRTLRRDCTELKASIRALHGLRSQLHEEGVRADELQWRATQSALVDFDLRVLSRTVTEDWPGGGDGVVVVDFMRTSHHGATVSAEDPAGDVGAESCVTSEPLESRP